MVVLLPQPKALKDVIRTGDFVYCRSKRYRDSLQLPQEAGVVLENKRSTFKVLYSSERRAWVQRDALVRLEPQATDAPEFLRVLNYLLLRVDAHECELTNVDGVYHISTSIDGIDVPTIDELRSFLGKRYVAMSVIPEAMAFVRTEIDFRLS